tara:strand:- start:11731 stop:12921 length:1191 start_codon:yes stop_codon:yes gene_type:complete
MIKKIFLIYFILIYVGPPIAQNIFELQGVFLDDGIILNNIPIVFFNFLLFITFFWIGDISTNSLFKKYFKKNIDSKIFIKKISNYKLNISIILFTPFIFIFLNEYFSNNLYRVDLTTRSNLINYVIVIILPFLIGLKLLKTNSKKSQIILSIIFFLVASLSILTGYRTGFISSSLFFLMIYLNINNEKTIKFFSLKNIIIIVAGLSFMTFYGAYRNEGFQDNIDLDTISVLQSSILRVSGPELLLIMIEKVNMTGYSFFKHNLIESFTILVPQAIWESKPTSLSEIISTEIYGNYLYRLGIIRQLYGGVAYGILSEAFYNLGTLGIIIYSYFTAFILNISDKWIRSKRLFKFLFSKAVIMNVLFLVESPQLGINAIIMNIFVSLAIVILISKFKFK